MPGLETELRLVCYFLSVCPMFWPLGVGAQGSADGNAIAELSGGAVQPAQLPGAAAVPLGERLPR